MHELGIVNSRGSELKVTGVDGLLLGYVGKLLRVELTSQRATRYTRRSNLKTRVTDGCHHAD
jgi:hypothetical protein